MNKSEREIINQLRSEDKTIRDQTFADVFYPKTGVRNVICQAVWNITYMTVGPKSKNLQSFYDTLTSLVFEDLKNANPSKIDEAENISGYFFTLAKNCRIRAINYIDGKTSVVTKREDELTLKDDRAQEEDNVDNGVLVIFEGDPRYDGMTGEQLATELIGRYISQIKNKEYRDILLAIDVGGVKPMKYAEELGVSPETIRSKHTHARIELVTIALPDIKKRSAEFYHKYRDLATSKDAELLDSFFDKNTTPLDVSKMKAKQKEPIAKAFHRLSKKVRSERKQNSKQWNRAVREYKNEMKELEKGDNK